MALSSTSDIIQILQTHFPGTLTFRRSLFILATVAAASPLLYRHFQQRNLPRQPSQTAWLTSAQNIVSSSFDEEAEEEELEDIAGLTSEEKQRILHNLSGIITFMDGEQSQETHASAQFVVAPPPILLTPHTTCRICTLPTGGHPQLFRGRCDPVTIIGPDFKKTTGYLVVATCNKCESHYYPNLISVKPQTRGQDRTQKLEFEPEWLCISKQGLWVHRKVALLQENATLELRGSWQRFRLFFNKTFGDGTNMLTERQTHRLFAEHFTRVLLNEHGTLEEFECPAFAGPAILIQAALQVSA